VYTYDAYGWNSDVRRYCGDLPGMLFCMLLSGGQIRRAGSTYEISNIMITIKIECVAGTREGFWHACWDIYTKS